MSCLEMVWMQSHFDDWIFEFMHDTVVSNNIDWNNRSFVRIIVVSIILWICILIFIDVVNCGFRICDNCFRWLWCNHCCLEKKRSSRAICRFWIGQSMPRRFGHCPHNVAPWWCLIWGLATCFSAGTSRSAKINWSHGFLPGTASILERWVPSV